MWPALPTSEYYGGSVPPWHHRLTVRLPADGLAGRRVGRCQSGSHVRCPPVDGGGIELYPCSLTTGTPQTFPVASRAAPITRPERGAATDYDRSSTAPAHIRQVRGQVRIKGRPTLVRQWLSLPVLLARPA